MSFKLGDRTNVVKGCNSIMEQWNLWNDIRSCQACNYVREKKIKPFCFFPNGQTVVFISLVPNVQATDRPLASIRFFRAVFMSLFGANPTVTSPVKVFIKNIYWTHYHKCYFPDYFLKEPKIPPPKCMNKYLNREIELLSPKLIIVAGAPLVKILFNVEVPKGQLIYSEWKEKPIECVLVNFPQSGAEPEYRFLRKQLKKSFGFLEIDDSEVTPDQGVQGYAEPRLKEYVQFELGALELYFNQILEDIKKYENCDPRRTYNVDEWWQKTEALPRIKRYSLIIACDSFIEDQAKAFLQYLGKPALEETSCRKLLDLVGKQLNGIYQKDYENLKAKILHLREMRNVIVHEGGQFENIDEKCLEYFGVDLEPNGTLVFGDQVAKLVLDIARKFVNLLISGAIK